MHTPEDRPPQSGARGGKVLPHAILLTACYVGFRFIGWGIRTAVLLCVFIASYVTVHRLTLLVRISHGPLMGMLVAVGIVPIGLLILDLAGRSRVEAATTATFACALLIAGSGKRIPSEDPADSSLSHGAAGHSNTMSTSVQEPEQQSIVRART